MSLKCRGSAAGARRRGGTLCDAPPLRQEGEAAARDGEAEAREGEAEAREGDTAARLSALDVILPAATAAPRASGIQSSLSTPRSPPRLMMSTGRAGQGIGRSWARLLEGNVLHRGGPERRGKARVGWAPFCVLACAWG